MLQSFMHNLWAFLGACSGLLFGVTKEGIDFFFSLKSVQGWKEIYTGTAANRSKVLSKKVDDGTPQRRIAQKPIHSEQAEVKQFLGARPPETKTSQHSPRSYSNFPILGGEAPKPVPAPGPVNLGLSPPRQPGSFPPVNAPAPFGLPAETANRADSLPDIFGSTSLMGGKPGGQPAPGFALTSTPAFSPAAAPAADASPDKGVVLNSSPNRYDGHEESYIPAASGSSADEGSSPEAKASTGSKMKSLKRRISSKLRGTKA